MIACDPAIDWTLPAQWHSALLNSDGHLRLNQWLADGSATIVKQAPHRSIYRIRIPGCDFFLKEYRAFGLRGWMREFIRPIKAESEFNKANRLTDRGIAVPHAIGWGVLWPRWSPQASFLLSATVKNAVPLTDYLNQSLMPAERQAIAQSLGSFVARLHAAGAVHRDFHPANLLFRKDPRGLPEFILIDLHEVQLGRSCSWRTRRENLITLNRWFILRSSRSDRLRFWRAYESRVTQPDRPDARPEAIEEATLQSNAAFWNAREKRYGPSSRHIKRLSNGLAVSDLDDTIARLLSDDPDQFFCHDDSRMLKEGGASTVSRVVQNGRHLVLKRFNVRSWLDPVKNGFRKSAALRSWLLGHALLDAGLPTARPLALFHRLRFGLPAEGYLVTEYLSDVVDLRTFADRLTDIDPVNRRQILHARLETVARIVREFHARHFGHRDLKAANLLTSTAPDDHRVWFIDLVGVCRRRRVRPKSCIRDLARLLVSFLKHPVLTTTDRLRFLRCYLNWNLHGKTGWKWWWRELSQTAQAKISRNLRVGRPLS